MGSLLSHSGRVAALVDDGDAAVRIAHRDIGHAIAITAAIDRARVVVLDGGEMHAGSSAIAEGGHDAVQIAGAAANQGGPPSPFMPVQNGIPSSMSGLGSAAGRERVCPSPSVVAPGSLRRMPVLVSRLYS